MSDRIGHITPIEFHSAAYTPTRGIFTVDDPPSDQFTFRSTVLTSVVSPLSCGLLCVDDLGGAAFSLSPSSDATRLILTPVVRRHVRACVRLLTFFSTGGGATRVVPSLTTPVVLLLAFFCCAAGAFLGIVGGCCYHRDLRSNK